MRILSLTRYERLGSSSRVRFFQYFPYLEAQGVEITSSPFFNDAYVQRIYERQAVNVASIAKAYAQRLWSLFDSSTYDILWIEKELFPWLPAWFEAFLQTRRVPYVVDYDDAVFHRYDMHPSTVVRNLLGNKIDRVMSAAALVIAGNEYLAERAERTGAARVKILPSVVDVQRYKVNNETNSALIRIGWIGSPVTAPYLEEIREALQVLSGETDAHLTLIGAGRVPPFAGIRTTALPWDEGLELSIGELFDIGIMPLVDGPFERGKCGYKLIQYMAGGLPVIASPVGVNRQIVEVGKTGYLASTTDEWLTAFRSLSHNKQLRAEMGRTGRQKAEQMYNLSVTAPKLLDLLASAQKAKNYRLSPNK
jgi:glycosyltransferase involved in cell wall biosynthesis